MSEAEITIRPLREEDLDVADRVMRSAFGTYLRLPDPQAFGGDASLVRTRFAADPSAAFAATREGEIVGSAFATRWGSVGFFGPLTVRPDLWDQGIAKRLLVPIVETFARWGVRHAGLFTFPQSPKHLGLYQGFDFWPGPLTAIMWKRVRRASKLPSVDFTLASMLAPERREAAERERAALTGAILDGLDVARETAAIAAQGLGDTVHVKDDRGELVAFAVCHVGGGSEAGSGAAYVKLGAVRPGPAAAAHFERLLDACEAFAASRSLLRLVAGVSLGRHAAYRAMLARGFRTEISGVTMHRANAPGYHSAEVWVLDDWR